MKHVHHADPVFDAFVSQVQSHLFAGGTEPLFTTDVDPEEIYSIYLGNLPMQVRQYHTCNCCRRFIQRYGTLARIDPQGRVVSAMWPAQMQGLYAESVAFMGGCVESARITGVFAVGTNDDRLGQDIEGGYTHLHVPTINMRREREPGPWMALKIQDFETLSRALMEYPVAIVAQAVALLEGDDLFRSEKVRGPARFLLDLHKAVEPLGMLRKEQRNNKIWAALAHAPVGWVTPRSGMIGTLLDDLFAGHSLASVKSRFATKMGPLAYRRPTAAPKAGQVAAAEKLFADLGLAPALKRRFATLEDLELTWRKPARVPAAKPISAGVFSSLLAQPAPSGRIEAITWSDFAARELSTAYKLEFQASSEVAVCALVTADDPAAPLLFQWDNPVSHYTYVGPRRASHWGLPNYGWIEVEAVTLAPYMWAGNHLPHMNPMALLLVNGCRDSNNGALGIFPEFLRSTMHGVRSVIEAYSNRNTIRRMPKAIAGLTVNGALLNTLRVTSDRGVKLYRITGW